MIQDTNLIKIYSNDRQQVDEYNSQLIIFNRLFVIPSHVDITGMDRNIYM